MIDRRGFVQSMLALGAAAGARPADVLFAYPPTEELKNLLFTGLTRDGLFLIEKGQITRPVKNLRWNESPIAALNNIEAMTPAERTVSGEGIGGSDGFTFGLVCPAARIREFTFSSASDAV
jgi:hypothetical protein